MNIPKAFSRPSLVTLRYKTHGHTNVAGQLKYTRTLVGSFFKSFETSKHCADVLCSSSVATLAFMYRCLIDQGCINCVHAHFWLCAIDEMCPVGLQINRMQIDCMEGQHVCTQTSNFAHICNNAWGWRGFKQVGAQRWIVEATQDWEAKGRGEFCEIWIFIIVAAAAFTMIGLRHAATWSVFLQMYTSKRTSLSLDPVRVEPPVQHRVLRPAVATSQAACGCEWRFFLLFPFYKFWARWKKHDFWTKDLLTRFSALSRRITPAFTRWGLDIPVKMQGLGCCMGADALQIEPVSL